jgi:murein L,D-transpeptidase YafK
VGASDCMVAWGTAGSGLSPCDTVKDDYIVVHKSARNLALCNSGTLVANYQAGLGFAPTGDKVQEGDGKTPEGVFYAANLLPNSSYYKAFLLSYPDSADAARGLSSGLITQAQKTAIDTAQANCTIPPQTTQLGSYVEVHGRGGTSDWTLGCVAIADTGIDALWAAIELNDTIVVLP